MTIKRDTLRGIEKKMQDAWKAESIFESDAPETSEEKFMATFPYPYMNGMLHLGHGFTASKAEFAVAYETMKGKKALWPFAFHCTGMPIKASADKLKKEMELYGCPPVLPESDSSDANSKAKHSKVAAKTGNAKLQWDILRQVGIPEEEIPKFADPYYWMEYFPPHAQADLTALGFHIDWRRSFITTDKNPFYDSFIRWQFNKLKAQNRIKFGKRHTIFSPIDGQPCLDHDRQSGEGVEPKEYTIIKLKVQSIPKSDKFEALNGKDVFLVAATLRPETMYGQTNCWVGPDVEYGAFLTNSQNEVFICTKRSALNMAFQGFAAIEGRVSCIAELKGSDLIGLPLSGPNAINPTIYVLPMFSVSASMGTGIVTSVPSNSPADYVALRELKEKEPLRRKFDIEDHMVLPFNPVPLIDSPNLGAISAETVVLQLNIKSQNDAVNLEKAKDLVYKDDFYAGTMSFGTHKGMTVQEAKTVIRDELISKNEVFIYFEPEKQVISRSGDECVVALTDQWYVDYGEPSWRALAEKCLEQMNCFSDEVRHQFIGTIDWMKQWACSRSFGLGSRLPWDPTYLIESLSDSTIYMAFYTIAHILHEGSLDGSVSPNGIKPEQMSDEVYEWIFGESNEESSALSKKSGISAGLLEKMRNEFRFWYPMDLRVSGKDLVPNHLTFSIYNHVAIFPEKFWPKGMRANGHLLLNSQKMSKSTGNFMTLKESVCEFGADATRLALADAGDSVEDANFLKDTANMAILRLFNQLEFYKEALTEMDNYRHGEYNYHDRVFMAEIEKSIVLTRSSYEKTHYRDALKFGFFELQNARDRYRESTVINGSAGMHKDVIKKFMNIQILLIAPITPHFCDYIWRELLNNSTSVLVTPFPSADLIDEELLASAHYLQSVTHELRTTLQAERRPKKGPARENLNSAEIFVAVGYPKWQEDAIQVLRSSFDGEKFVDDSAIVAGLKPLMKNGPNKKLIPFVMELKNKVLSEGLSALDRKLPFDELSILTENVDYLTKSLGLLDINIKPFDPIKEEIDNLEADKKRKMETALPGEPAAFFFAKD